MDKQSVPYPFNRVLFSHEKECSTDTGYSTDKPQRHAKWKKPVMKTHRLYDSIYMKRPEEANSQRQKVDYWLPESGKGEMGNSC